MFRHLAAVALSATAAFAQPSAPSSRLDSLIRDASASWTSARSRHFVVHVENPQRAHWSATAMLDTLEAGWWNAVKLLGAPVADEPPVDVFVTSSPLRFAMPPEVKGMTTYTPTHREFIVLIHNDSIRPYARHEVMHVLSRRAWGTAPPSLAWLTEGIATFADPVCQRATIDVAARDLLRRDKQVTAWEVETRFLAMHKEYRARAYVLAGSLVAYLWESRGREGVRRLWQQKDSLSAFSSVTAFSSSLSPATTAGWRAYVERAAGTAPALDTTAFRRFGCG